MSLQRLLCAESNEEWAMGCQLPDEHPECCNHRRKPDEGCDHVVGYDSNPVRVEQWDFVARQVLEQVLKSIHEVKNLEGLQKAILASFKEAEWRKKGIRDP